MSAHRNHYQSSPSYTMTLRLKLRRRPGTLARALAVIARAKAAVGALDLVESAPLEMIRDVTVQVRDERHGQGLVSLLKAVSGIEVVSVSDRTFLMHLGGKIEVQSKVAIKTRDDLSMAYTPGVARVCLAIAARKEDVWALTIKRNMVAIVTDGTRVLGLGDIGPEAALPVMEGKAAIFKTFGGVNAFPICLDTKDEDEIVRTVKAIAPGFGAINLEDIAAPRCFRVEKRLKAELEIPVFHDDQHGTAIVTLAGLLNALRLVRKPIKRIKIVISGAGAAGMAVAGLLREAGARNIIGFDRAGAVYRGRPDNMTPEKEEYALLTNPDKFSGTLSQALRGADVFIGLARPGLVGPKDLAHMAKNAIIFALANPDPDIDPDVAWRYARIVGTGRSDLPNQINNALAFPGVFRGALDARSRSINAKMNLAAARAIASVVEPSQLKEDYVVPSLFNLGVAPAVADAVRAAAISSGVARVIPA